MVAEVLGDPTGLGNLPVLNRSDLSPIDSEK
jgi:hypothetical protein